MPGIIASGIGFMLRPANGFLCESVVAVVTALSSSISADVFCTESVATGTDVFCAKA